MLLQELNEKLIDNYHEPIYEMENLYEVLSDKLPSQIVMMTKHDGFDFRHKYFTINGYGNFKSYETLDEVLEMYDDIE